jgi:hypothetical protein
MTRSHNASCMARAVGKPRDSRRALRMLSASTADNCIRTHGLVSHGCAAGTAASGRLGLDADDTNPFSDERLRKGTWPRPKRRIAEFVRHEAGRDSAVGARGQPPSGSTPGCVSDVLTARRATRSASLVTKWGPKPRSPGKSWPDPSSSRPGAIQRTHPNIGTKSRGPAAPRERKTPLISGAFSE